MERQEEGFVPTPVDRSEVILYSDVKTRTEITSSSLPIIDFSKADIKVMYEDLYFPVVTVARIIGKNPSSTSNVLKDLGVQIRDRSSDPVLIKKRIEATRNAYLDPEKKAAAVAKIHTPESDILRSKAMKKKLANDPLYKQSVSEAIVKASNARKIAQDARREQKNALKEEQARQKIERSTQFAMELLESPGFNTLTPRQRQVIQLRYRTDGGLQLSMRQVGQIMGITYQGVQFHEMRALRKLRIARKSLAS